jgi:hypothetical protein
LPLSKKGILDEKKSKIISQFVEKACNRKRRLEGIEALLEVVKLTSQNYTLLSLDM